MTSARTRQHDRTNAPTPPRSSALRDIQNTAIHITAAAHSAMTSHTSSICDGHEKKWNNMAVTNGRSARPGECIPAAKNEAAPGRPEAASPHPS